MIHRYDSSYKQSLSAVLDSDSDAGVRALKRLKDIKFTPERVRAKPKNVKHIRVEIF